MENLKNKRILAFIGLICLFLGVIMPYFKASLFGLSYEIKLWGFWEGKVMMLLIVANLLFIFKDYVEKYIPQLFNNSLGNKIKNANPKFAILPTIGVAAFAIYLYVKTGDDLKYLKYGFGFYSLWIGVLCMIGHTFIYKKNSNIVSSNQVNSTHQAQQEYIPYQETKICSGCGSKCDLNSDSCFMCGKHF